LCELADELLAGRATRDRMVPIGQLQTWAAEA